MAAQKRAVWYFCRFVLVFLTRYIRAFVTLIPGVASDDAQTVKPRDYVKSQLTPFKAPRLFDYMADLPKTGTGKIDRQALLSVAG